MVGNRERAARARLVRALRGLATVASLAAGAKLSAYSASAQVPLLIGILGFFPLFVAIRVHRAPIASLCGTVWGLLLFLQLSAWGSVDRTVSTALIFAAAPACHAALGSLLTRWVGFSPLVLGVTWFGVEFALSAAGLPRGLFAGVPEETAILGAIAHGLGVVFVGFLAAYVSATLVCAISVVQFPGAPARVFVRAIADGEAIQVPQTLRCVPSFIVHSSQCRAPPRVCLSAL